ncbi:MAG: ferrous iron transport protein B [Desulfobacteraceae bacterium]
MKSFTIALAGNPNSGKTTIFNNLTGANQKVGNWPGVTVEKKEGKARHKEYDINIVDLPGTYSLTPFSAEEIAARDFILTGKPDVVVIIIDASNLERSLYLAMQVAELGRPVVFALNMADVARAKGITIDAEQISALLNIPVVFTVGNRNQGTEALLDTAVNEAGQAPEEKKTRRGIKYSHEIEKCIESVVSLLESGKIHQRTTPIRWNAVKLLEGDKIITREFENDPDLIQVVEKCRDRIEDLFQEDPEMVLTDDRYGFIAGIVKEAVSISNKKRVDISRDIDLVLTNRILGFPIFLFFIWAMFQLTFSLGAYPMEWIDSGLSILTGFLDTALSPSYFKDLLLDGIVAGIGSVIIFLPNILILFFCIALFEDTGYMARAAFLMDRIMHMVGLHGKSFIPMLMGFGCNVPAIMATRTLENRKDRILTALLTPFMSCSARLPVYLILAGTFFPKNAGTVIFLLYFTGITVAVLSGKLLRSTALKGEDAPFVMELPPYRAPMMKSLLIHMWDRSKIFLKKMGGIILVGSIIIWTLSYFPRDIDWSKDYAAQTRNLKIELAQADTASETGAISAKLQELTKEKKKERVAKSYIGMIGKSTEPFFEPLGIEWRSSVALITGLVAKEIVVSTMGVLYGVDNQNPNALESALKSSGMNPLSALSLMVFVLLYIPCTATIIAIWKETSGRWAFFNLIYTTAVAWGLSFLVYQSGSLLGFG